MPETDSTLRPTVTTFITSLFAPVSRETITEMTLEMRPSWKRLHLD